VTHLSIDGIAPKKLEKRPKRERWDISGECRIQLVETVPDTLKAHNYAKDMPVEHMSTMEVNEMKIISVISGSCYQTFNVITIVQSPYLILGNINSIIIIPLRTEQMSEAKFA